MGIFFYIIDLFFLVQPVQFVVDILPIYVSLVHEHAHEIQKFGVFTVAVNRLSNEKQKSKR